MNCKTASNFPQDLSIYNICKTVTINANRNKTQISISLAGLQKTTTYKETAHIE